MSQTDPTKDILRLFTYGLYVAAAASPDGPRAATISWVTQASFEPRLLAVALRKGTAICEAVRASGRFALHLVGADQPDFAKAFFKVSQSGPDEIAGYHFTLDRENVPIFDIAPAWLACEAVEEVNLGGDHAIFLSRIRASGVRTPGATALTLRDTPWHYGG